MDATKFRKSSYSTNDNCVEIAFTAEGVQVRDSNYPSAALAVSGDDWDAFVAGVKAGEFDR